MLTHADDLQLNDMLLKLNYKAKRQEVEDMIWEVDEDCDKCVSWDEFKLMFHRCRSDRVQKPMSSSIKLFLC